MFINSNTEIAILVRIGHTDGQNWAQLVSTDQNDLWINFQRRLCWTGGGKSTEVCTARCDANKVTLFTESGAEYHIVFPLISHGKAEWRSAQSLAHRLCGRLVDEWQEARYA